jgi:NAD(P)H dehydrogenase (quinone)
MPKILVLYCSTYGHIEILAGAVAEGARSSAEPVGRYARPEELPATNRLSSNGNDSF